MCFLPEKKSILVVDDMPDILEVLNRNLVAEGYRVYTAASVSEAIRFLEKNPVELVITDMKMPKVSGIDLVRHVRENLKETEIIMITGYASIESAIEAVKAGAEEYIPKPFTDKELLSAVQRALDKLNSRRAGMKQPGKKISETFGLFGESACMRKIFQCIKKATTTPATVLLSGESGTGKELVARAIHYNSKRASAPFVPVNCGSIPEGLLESELFGYVKGAFTGAHESRAGFFQTADGGTIFLDEIGETSIAMQIKLLRVLQEKEVYMVGDSKPKKVDIRIIAATNKDLKKLIEKGSFREELYFRINVITIDIPPLRERGNDILLLAHQFLTKFSTELGKPMPQLTDNSRRALLNYDWPGNVRELENVMQRVVVMSEDTVIDVPDLPAIMRFSVQQDRGTHRTLAEMEREHIGYVLRSVDGNKTRAAQILGVDRKTLRERIKQYQLPAG